MGLDGAQLQRACLACRDSLALIPSTAGPGHGGNIYNPSTERQKKEDQKFKSIFDYVVSCLSLRLRYMGSILSLDK